MRNDVRYSVNFWGRNAKQLNIEMMLNGYVNVSEKETFSYLFNSEEEYLDVIGMMKKLIKDNSWMVGVSTNESIIAHYQVIAKMVLEYNGKDYPYEYNFGYGYDPDSAHFMFFEGNYSCDCNLYDFLYETYGEEELGEYVEKDCGESILIKDFHIVLKESEQ